MGMTQTTDYLQTSLGELPVVFRNMSAEVTVPSSKPGQFYTVTITKSFASCTCKGFHFRKAGKECRHITAVRTAIQA